MMKSPTPEPPFDPQSPGISLDELAQAFAEVMGVEPRRPAEAATASTNTVTPVASESTDAKAADSTGDEADSCPISPRTIFEAMLFVGNSDNRPLTPRQAAELMRDVGIDEIPALVDELNRRYESQGSPFHVVGEADGYRLTLRGGFQPVRDRFYGRIRETRLSQAAVDVLALVAYQQPISGEEVGRLRGKPSSHILTQLVRRGLLRIERPDPKSRSPHYRTTDRFLSLFNLDSLDELPRSDDAGPP